MSLSKPLQHCLLEIARNSIAHGLQYGASLAVDMEELVDDLKVVTTTFVTLEINEQLRGCIGTLEAIRPLASDVAENAFNAGFNDPRFPALQAHEFNDLQLSISILSPAYPINFISEKDLIQQLCPNIDGLIIEEGGRRGTFLPSVWLSLPEPEQFLRHLKQKAGLPADYWSDTLCVYRYTTELIT